MLENEYFSSIIAPKKKIRVQEVVLLSPEPPRLSLVFPVTFKVIEETPPGSVMCPMLSRRSWWRPG
jgi:hypothetical protein